MSKDLEISSKRLILSELYYKCTEAQRNFFDQMYVGGFEKIEDKKIDWAIKQCENTILRNNLRNPVEKIDLLSQAEIILFIGSADYYIFPDVTLIDGWLLSHLIRRPEINYKAPLTLKSIDRVQQNGYKLFLRPISDLTEEETLTYTELIKSSDDINNSISASARGIKYLISIGIDVFNWIKEGKALDKALLKDLEKDL